MNYGESRYAVDREPFPNRIYFGSESFPTRIAELWPMITRNNNILGDFTWTGWDFLGEVGTGRHVYPEDAQAHRAPYPWIAAVCGDIDLIGDRKPISYYREIVFGLTDIPYLAVRRPREDGYVIEPKAWTWSDVLPSWSWDVPEGTSLHVEAYAAGDEVAFMLNGNEVARAEVGRTRPFMADADISYTSGVLEVIAYSDGAELGRRQLRSTADPSRIHVDVDRDFVHANEADLIHVELTLVDENYRRHCHRDVELTVSIDGPAVLQGFGSANPVTEASYLANTAATFNGRALAVVRATREPGSITITVRSDEYADAAVTIESVPSRIAPPSPIATG